MGSGQLFADYYDDAVCTATKTVTVHLLTDTAFEN
jgi:hypothetical protein